MRNSENQTRERAAMDAPSPACVVVGRPAMPACSVWLADSAAGAAQRRSVVGVAVSPLSPLTTRIRPADGLERGVSTWSRVPAMGCAAGGER